MSTVRNYVRDYSNAEKMADEVLKYFFKDEKIDYPINPFKILKDEGVEFYLGSFEKLEGAFIPKADDTDVDLVLINVNRPITRQRFTAAHELCHYIKDSDKDIACPLSSSDPVEKFANNFAAALLMPISELRKQVNMRKKDGCVDFDDILEIASFFGVSFESCLYRVAYKLHAIDGETDSSKLKRRIHRYSPEAKRKIKGINYVLLYEQLVDTYSEVFSFEPSEYSKNKFINEYVFNDSRIENIDVTVEEASEIVTDLRLNGNEKYSGYCIEEKEAYMSVAGNYKMYEDMLTEQLKEEYSVYDAIDLNRKLFSYFPYPEFGGKIRETNVVISGANFEAVDYKEILDKLDEQDKILADIIGRSSDMPLSKYIEQIIKLHHNLTVIHPFSDGNGRTLRAFFNLLLVYKKINPIYIKTTDKKEYIESLSVADITGNYAPLYELYFKILLRTNVELIDR